MYWISILLFFVTFSVQAQSSRHALVIGNSDYVDAGLTNPYNDATDMANMLESLGFKLHGNSALYNLTQKQFTAEIDSFTASLPRDAVALVYFAGHGTSWGGDNYLLPIGAEISSPMHLSRQAISLTKTMAAISRQNSEGINLYFLDACREYPSLESVTGSVGLLRRPQGVPHSSFIGYAAEEGAVASDGLGSNGTYTAELLSAMRNHANEPVLSMHDIVKQRVFDHSEKLLRRQVPMEVSTITRLFCLGSCDDSAGSTTQAEEPGKNMRSILYLALGAIAVALLTNSSSSDPDPDTVTLNLTPPAQ